MTNSFITILTAPNKMSYESLDAQMTELLMYALNFSDVHYNQSHKCIAKHWLHHRNGSPAAGWDRSKALRYVQNALINPAAKDYKREFGSMSQSWTMMWPKIVRDKAAEEALDMWLDEFQLGNLPTL
jgi:hypothetical protein